MVTRIKIDIVSDILCPWCYVGKKSLQAAIERAKTEIDFDVEINMRPYFLDPTLPEKGIDKMEHYARKFGAERRDMMISRLQQASRGYGFTMNFGGVVSNSMRGHCLTALAKEQGLQMPVMMELFVEYYERNGDIGDIDTLVALADNCGVIGAREYLESRQGEDAVRAEAALFSGKFDVNGVPHFIFNDGKFEMSGAQPPARFVDVLRRLVEEEGP